MPNWFYLAVTTVILWGVWGMLLKLAVDRLGPNTTFFFHSVAFAIVVVGYKFAAGFKVATETPAILLAVGAAVFAASGALSMVNALARGTASTVFPIVALYPAVTVLLSLAFLKERLSPPQGLGVALAILAGFLLSRS
jgi:uncharacterized membrane protein